MQQTWISLEFDKCISATIRNTIRIWKNWVRINEFDIWSCGMLRFHPSFSLGSCDLFTPEIVSTIWASVRIFRISEIEAFYDRAQDMNRIILLCNIDLLLWSVCRSFEKRISLVDLIATRCDVFCSPEKANTGGDRGWFSHCRQWSKECSIFRI